MAKKIILALVSDSQFNIWSPLTLSKIQLLDFKRLSEYLRYIFKLVKLVLPQAMKLSIQFYQENQLRWAFTRDLFKDPLLRGQKKKRKKAQHPAGVKPMISR